MCGWSVGTSDFRNLVADGLGLDGDSANLHVVVGRGGGVEFTGIILLPAEIFAVFVEDESGEDEGCDEEEPVIVSV